MITNCYVCGRLFKSSYGDICSRCLEDEGSPYSKIKNYLYNNRGANALEISEATGVSITLLIKYINEEHFKVIEEKKNQCSRCGREVESDGNCYKCGKQPSIKKDSNEINLKITSTQTSKFGNRSRRK